MRLLAPAAVLAGLLLALPLAAQSSRVQVDVPDAARAAPLLEERGFVVESLDPEGLWVEIILPDTDLPRLQALGWPVRVLEHSRPLQEVLGGDALDSRFYTWTELNQELLNWQNAYPNLARRVDLNATLGTPLTHEGRTLYALKISDNVTLDEDEPAVLLVANHHAREISTPVAALALIEDLLTNYGVDPATTARVDGNEIWIVPTWNPDGLEYVWNVDQWWRKNRRNNGGGIYGVDLNRNYPFRWAYCGNYSHTPSSSVYVGPSAASEPETQTMLALARSRRFAKVLDLHTSGQEVLYPYTCMSMPAPVASEVQAVRNLLAGAAAYGWRLASSSGEHFEWEFNEIGAISYLLELDTTFFPSWNQAQGENARVLPAFHAMLDEPIPLRGHVYDAWDGTPLADVDIAAAGVTWSEGELRRSGPGGRYHYWIGQGSRTFTFQKSGWFSQSLVLDVGPAGLDQDVFLPPGNRPYLTLVGVPVPGGQIRFQIQNAAAWSGGLFTVWLSSSGGGPFVPGIPISGGLTVPLVQDSVTAWGLAHANLTQGSIDTFGFGNTPWARVSPKVSGWDLWVAGVVELGGVNQIVTPALAFTVQ